MLLASGGAIVAPRIVSSLADNSDDSHPSDQFQAAYQEYLLYLSEANSAHLLNSLSRGGDEVTIQQLVELLPEALFNLDQELAHTRNLSELLSLFVRLCRSKTLVTTLQTDPRSFNFAVEVGPNSDSSSLISLNQFGCEVMRGAPGSGGQTVFLLQGEAAIAEIENLLRNQSIELIRADVGREETKSFELELTEPLILGAMGDQIELPAGKIKMTIKKSHNYSINPQRPVYETSRTDIELESLEAPSDSNAQQVHLLLVSLTETNFTPPNFFIAGSQNNGLPLFIPNSGYFTDQARAIWQRVNDLSAN